MSFVLSGCATFNPPAELRDLLSTQRSTAKQTLNALEISADEYVSSDKSRKAFDTELAPRGVLAVLLRLNNRSTSNYLVDQTDAKAHLKGEKLPRLAGVDAARQATTSDAAAKAAAWTAATGPFALAFWPITISVSASHTKDIDRKIELHFQNFELGKVLVRPDQSAGGFLFFNIPNGVDKLEGLTLEVLARDKGKTAPLNFKLSFATLELSSPAVSPMTSLGDTTNKGENP